MTISGTLKDPGFSATFKVTDGGIRAFAFQSLEGSGRWTGDGISGDVRLDQRPGTWLTARGSVPMDLFSSAGSAKPVDVAVRSSAIDLGLIEGVTTAVRNVVGTLELNVTVKGQANDPRFDGFLDVKGASFEVPSTGIRYQNGTAHLAFVPEAVTVEQFRLEDSKGNPLELTGTGRHPRSEPRRPRIRIERDAVRSPAQRTGGSRPERRRDDHGHARRARDWRRSRDSSRVARRRCTVAARPTSLRCCSNDHRGDSYRLAAAGSLASRHCGTT